MTNRGRARRRTPPLSKGANVCCRFQRGSWRGDKAFGWGGTKPACPMAGKPLWNIWPKSSRRARNPHVLVVAADLQRLSGAFLQTFAAELGPEDRCLVLRSGGLLEPLCSIYHREALPRLEQMRREGKRRPRALFDAVPTRYVDLERLGWDSKVVANVNTEQDYEALLREP